MESIEIRTAVDEDLVALRDVFRHASWSNEGDRPLLTAHPEFLELSSAGIREGRTGVASIDGRIVGFASIVRCGDSIEVEDLFVHPDSMRGGIGRALIEDLADRARVEGALLIGVDANEHTLVFYERVGFTAVGKVALEHGTAIRMTRSAAEAGAFDD